MRKVHTGFLGGWNREVGGMIGARERRKDRYSQEREHLKSKRTLNGWSVEWLEWLVVGVVTPAGLAATGK